MENHKRCIFHVPNYVDAAGRSGSQVRPVKMLNAFIDLGYDVDVVMGYGRERREAIKCIKKRINRGVRYEFLYSESSTMPTLLTERNHLPTYPFLDFGFFKFCRKHSIKVGLFYRDAIWKFDQYKVAVPWYYRIITFFFYKYDLWKYNHLVDILYLPSERIGRYLPEIRKMNIRVLPPGAEYNKEILKKRQDFFKARKLEALNIFYVGGVSGIYDIIEFVKVISEMEKTSLTICCKKDEWEKEEKRYLPFLTKRIKIVHESKENLAKYYLNADICSCYFDIREHKYMQLAIPIKLLEAVSFVTPVIATADCCAGDFVKKYNIGWSIPYEKSSICTLLNRLLKNPEEILSKQKAMFSCLDVNTWGQRVIQIEKDLRREK